MVTIPLGVTNEDYRSHFSSAFGASIGVHNTLMDKALEAFNCAGTCLSVFRTDPCLFPRYKTYAIEDYSLVTGQCYPSQEGARMVGLTSEAMHTKVLKRKATITDDASSSSIQTKRQTTLTQSKTGQLGLQLPVNEARVTDGFQQKNVNKQFFQPKIVTIAQLKANRTALQQFNKEWMSQQPHSEPGFEEYQPSNLVQCDWSEYGINPGITERMQSYIDTLMFRSVWEHDLDIGDTVVLLHKLKFANPLTNEDLLNRSHLLYMVDEINGARKYLSFVRMMHTPSEYPELPGLFPNKVTILIDGNYISIEQSPDAHTEVQEDHGSTRAVNQARPLHESRRSEQRPDEEDNLSEDSDARRITKKSTMEVNGHTFEIYGKTAIRENLIKSTGIRRLMQTGHMVTLLRTSGHGSYGNTITTANIIDGVIKLADDNNATSIFSKLNTAVNHNKLQVALQAWWQHTDLHEIISPKIASGANTFYPSLSPQRSITTSQHTCISWSTSKDGGFFFMNCWGQNLESYFSSSSPKCTTNILGKKWRPLSEGFSRSMAMRILSIFDQTGQVPDLRPKYCV